MLPNINVDTVIGFSINMSYRFSMEILKITVTIVELFFNEEVIEIIVEKHLLSKMYLLLFSLVRFETFPMVSMRTR